MAWNDAQVVGVWESFAKRTWARSFRNEEQPSPTNERGSDATGDHVGLAARTEPQIYSNRCQDHCSNRECCQQFTGGSVDEIRWLENNKWPHAMNVLPLDATYELCHWDAADR